MKPGADLPRRRQPSPRRPRAWPPASGASDPVEPATQVGHEKLAGGILAERADREVGVEEQDLARRRGRLRRDDPDLPGAVVAEDVPAPERRNVGAPIDVAAGHGATTVAVV